MSSSPLISVSILGKWGNKVKSTIYIQLSCSSRLAENTHTSVFYDNNSMNILLKSTHEYAPSDFAFYGHHIYY